MRFATVFTLGIAVVSTSASLIARVVVPLCYDTCVAIALADVTACSTTDYKCLCDDPSYVSQAVNCLEEICVGADLADSIAIGQSVCQAVDATFSVSESLSLPTSGSAPEVVTVTPTGGAAPTTVTLAVPVTTTSGSLPTTIPNSKSAASAHDANLNSFVGLAVVGLVALIIY